MAIVIQKELIQLRWRHRGGREHGMGLSAVVDLVLEEVQEQMVQPFHHDARAALGGHTAGRVGRIQTIAEGDEAGILRGHGEGRLLGVGKGGAV